MTTDDFAAIADVYDRWSSDDVKDDLPFWVAEARAGGGPVLEIGVGTGRVAMAIARSGIEVVGIDVSPSMLERARRRRDAERPAATVELLAGDMRALDLGGRRFPLVIMPYRVLAHALTTEEQLATLDGVRRHLEPGGRLVFTLPVPRAEHLTTTDALRMEGRYPLDDGGEAVLWRQVDYVPATQLVRFGFVVDHLDDAGTVVRRVHGTVTVRQPSPGEIEHALARAGFRVVDRWGWFDHRPFDAHATELVWAAQRQDGWRRGG